MAARSRLMHAINGDRITPSRHAASGGKRSIGSRVRHHRLEIIMANAKGPNIKKKQKCKNCEGKGLLKKGDKVVKCQRCGGTGVR
jgi:DnaJ-class molecular chaperone